MNALQLGSTLLQKYRIDRFRRRKDGVLLYEGVDASRLRRVCIKLLDRAASNDAVKAARFHDEAHGANVIDIGTCEGLPYFVTTECELVPPPPRRTSSKPPPLPKRHSSKPPPLPKPKLPPVIDIPIFVEDDVTVLELPKAAPPPPRPRVRVRASWFLFVAIAATTGFAGWSVGRAQSDVAPAAPPEPIMTQHATADKPRESPPAAVVESATPPTVESATSPPSKPRPKPTVDPLTI